MSVSLFISLSSLMSYGAQQARFLSTLHSVLTEGRSIQLQTATLLIHLPWRGHKGVFYLTHLDSLLPKKGKHLGLLATVLITAAQR
jgi:hypothetical protein